MWGDECQCLDDGVLIGNAFWSDLDVKGQSFQEDDRELLLQIFQPRLSDRRLEGDRFVPPDVNSANMDKLRTLLKNEEFIRLKRKAYFFDKKFSAENPGPLFPSSWAASFKIADGNAKGIQTKLVPRPELLAEADVLKHALSFASPVFSSQTEESVKFCIYRLGTLEVRTTQEPAGKEIIGAVFSAQAGLETTAVRPIVTGHVKILRATLYVERFLATMRQGKAKLLRRYYVVLETENGDKVVTQKVSDGKMTFEENPIALEDRNSLARVMLSVETTARSSVDDFKEFQAGLVYRAKPGPPSLSDCKRYARAVLTFASDEARNGDFRLQQHLAHQSAGLSRKKNVTKKTASNRPPSFVGLAPPVLV
jgi:hypothetical protein